MPVKLTGNSEGVKQGGKLILSKRKVRISATMENLPDEIVVDVTTLGLGKSIFVGDLKYDHITILTPATTAICAVSIIAVMWAGDVPVRCGQEIVRSHTGFLTNILLRNLRGMRQDIFTLNSCEIEIPDRRAGQYRRRVRRNPA